MAKPGGVSNFCNQGFGFRVPQIGSCKIAEPKRTHIRFLFDSPCLESASSRLNAFCSVSWGSCMLMFDGSDSRRDILSFEVIVG